MRTARPSTSAQRVRLHHRVLAPQPRPRPAAAQFPRETKSRPVGRLFAFRCEWSPGPGCGQRDDGGKPLSVRRSSTGPPRPETNAARRGPGWRDAATAGQRALSPADRSPRSSSTKPFASSLPLLGQLLGPALTDHSPPPGPIRQGPRAGTSRGSPAGASRVRAAPLFTRAVRLQLSAGSASAGRRSSRLLTPGRGPAPAAARPQAPERHVPCARSRASPTATARRTCGRRPHRARTQGRSRSR